MGDLMLLCGASGQLVVRVVEEGLETLGYFSATRVSAQQDVTIRMKAKALVSMNPALPSASFSFFYLFFYALPCL